MGMDMPKLSDKLLIGCCIGLSALAACQLCLTGYRLSEVKDSFVHNIEQERKLNERVRLLNNQVKENIKIQKEALKKIEISTEFYKEEYESLKRTNDFIDEHSSNSRKGL